MAGKTVVLTHFQTECLADRLGRANVINYLFDHPRGLSFRAIKKLENNRLSEHYPESQDLLQHIPDEMLSGMIGDLELAELVYEVPGKRVYKLVAWFRRYLRQLMKHAEKEHPRYVRRRPKNASVR